MTGTAGGRRAAAAAVVLGSSVLLGTTASADEPDATGWWASHRATPPALGLPTGNPPVDQPDPTVPPGGLYVAGEHTTTDEDEIPDPNGSQNPNAPSVDDPPPQATGISAVRLRVGDDTAVGDLVLTFHKENGVDRAHGVVSIQACPATVVWTPDDGGPISSAPPFDCSTGLAFGAVEGSNVRIPVGGLVHGGVLDIVLMPQPGSAFQASFAKPGSNALTVTRYSGGGGGEGGGGEETCEACLPPTVPPPTFTPVADPIADILVSAPGPPPDQVAVSPPPTTRPSRPIADFRRPTPDSPFRLEGWKKTLAGGVLGALAVLYAWLLRLPQRSPRLGTAAAAAGAAATATATTGADRRTRALDAPRGVGRFARPRTGPPPAL